MNWLQRLLQGPQNMLAQPQSQPSIPMMGQPMDNASMRVAQAAGTPNPNMAPMPGGMAAPQQQAQQPGMMDRFKQFRDGDRGQYLGDMFAGMAMGATPGQSLGMGAAMAREGKNQRKGTAKEQERLNQTVEYLKGQGLDPDSAALVASDPKTLQEFLKQMLAPEGQNPTDTMRNLEWRAREAGLQPGTKEYAEFMATGGSKGINVDARNMGSIPQGYRMIYDDQGNPVQMEAIPGGPEDKSDQAAVAAENRATSGDTITNAAATARQLASEGGRRTTGLGGQILSGIGETDAAELRRQVEVLKSKAKIENLTAMRAASPTGGALGAVSDKENQMLADAAGALEPNARPDVFMKQLDEYERTLLRVIHGRDAGDAIFEQTRAAGEQTAPAANNAPPARIETEQDYMNLPSGAEFIAPDGSVRRKP